MTSPTEPKVESLRKLRERVAGLTGPDRQIDRLVALHVGGWDRRWDENVKPHKGGWYWKDTVSDTSWTHEGFDECPPNYTASIDAALALVERVLPGWLSPFISRRQRWADIGAA